MQVCALYVQVCKGLYVEVCSPNVACILCSVWSLSQLRVCGVCQSLCRSLVSACFHPMYGLLVNSLAHSACQCVLPVYNQLILPLPKITSLLPTPVPTLGHTSKQGDFLLLLQL